MKSILKNMMVYFTVCTGLVYAQPHAGDVVVGQTAHDRLKVGGLAEEQPMVVVFPAVSGILEGWADSEPGFDHQEIDEPEKDFYTLTPGVDVWFEASLVDPALKVYEIFTLYIEQAGDVMPLGDEALHVHPTWHIDSEDPVFDPLRTGWRLQGVLYDATEALTDSEKIFFLFRNVDCMVGDVNSDGQLNGLEDWPAFLDVLSDTAGATTEERCASDANYDGVVTQQDRRPMRNLLWPPLTITPAAGPIQPINIEPCVPPGCP